MRAEEARVEDWEVNFDWDEWLKEFGKSSGEVVKYRKVGSMFTFKKLENERWTVETWYQWYCSVPWNTNSAFYLIDIDVPVAKQDMYGILNHFEGWDLGVYLKDVTQYSTINSFQPKFYLSPLLKDFPILTPLHWDANHSLFSYHLVLHGEGFNEVKIWMKQGSQMNMLRLLLSGKDRFIQAHNLQSIAYTVDEV